jgi:hypothetical protein
MTRNRKIKLAIILGALSLVACYGYYGSYYLPDLNTDLSLGIRYYYYEPASNYYHYYYNTCYACHYDYYWNSAWQLGFYHDLWNSCSYRRCSNCYDDYWFSSRPRYYNRHYYEDNPRQYQKRYEEYNNSQYHRNKPNEPAGPEWNPSNNQGYKPNPDDPWSWVYENPIDKRDKVKVPQVKKLPDPTWKDEGFLPWINQSPTTKPETVPQQDSKSKDNSNKDKSKGSSSSGKRR